MCIRDRGLTCLDAEGVKKLDDVSFTARSGEILGVAGIAGSGQKELLEAIAGLYPITKGSIRYTPEGKETFDLVGRTPMQLSLIHIWPEGICGIDGDFSECAVQI